MPYPKTYYSERLDPKPDALPVLASQIKTDTCIVGGGLAGLTLAHQLGKAGKDCVLLEKYQVGWGASGRNGGFVSPGFAQSISILETKLGQMHAQALFAETVKGTEFVRAQAAKMPDVIQGQGRLKLLRYNALDELKRTANHMNTVHGRSHAVLSRDALSQHLSSDTYHHAIFDPDTFTIDPLAYAQSLKSEFSNHDTVAAFENTPAFRLERNGASWLVTTASGMVKAEQVVLAGSAYLGKLHPPLSRAVLPVATYVVSTEGLGDALDEAIRFRGALSDTRLAGDYYRRIDADRLLWGGRITTLRSEPHKLAEMLKRQIVDIYPQLSALDIRHAWSGLMGYAVHKMPIIGELRPGLWSCTAFGGHGLSTTAMGASIVADAIATGDDRWRLFEPFKVRWGGGAVGRAGTQLVYWSMQLKDRLQESHAN
ncbi:MAG: FAD-binding oxidoreductase [Hyphomicrobiales bacterium]